MCLDYVFSRKVLKLQFLLSIFYIRSQIFAGSKYWNAFYRFKMEVEIRIVVCKSTKLNFVAYSGKRHHLEIALILQLGI